MKSKRPWTRFQDDQVLIRKWREQKEKSSSKENDGSIGISNPANERGVKRNNEEITELYSFESFDTSSDENSVRNGSVGKKSNDGFVKSGLRKKHKISAKKRDDMSEDDAEVIILRDDVEDDSRTRAYSMDLGDKNKIKHRNQMRKSNSFKKNIDIGLRKEHKISAGIRKKQNIRSGENARDNGSHVLYQLIDEEESSEEYFKSRTDSKKMGEKGKTKLSSSMRKGNNGLERDKIPSKKSVIPKRVDRLRVNNEKGEGRVGSSKKGGVNAKIGKDSAEDDNVIRISIGESDGDDNVKIIEEVSTMNSICLGSRKEHRTTVVSDFDKFQKKEKREVNLPEQKRGKSGTSNGVNGERMGESKKRKKLKKTTPNTESSEEVSEDSSESGNSSDSSYKEERASSSSDDVVLSSDKQSVASSGSGSVGEDERDESNKKKSKMPVKKVSVKRKNVRSSSPANGKREDRKVVKKRTKVGEPIRILHGSGSTKKVKSKSKNDILGTSNCPFILDFDELSEDEQFSPEDERVPPKVGKKVKHVPKDNEEEHKEEVKDVPKDNEEEHKEEVKDVPKDNEEEHKEEVKDVPKDNEEEHKEEVKDVPKDNEEEHKEEVKVVPKDNEEEHKEEKKAEKPVKNKRNAPLSSINQSLVNSIWEKGSAQLKDNLFTPIEDPPDEIELLPLKFKGFSDSDEDTEIPEKSEWDLEGEELFKELDYVNGILDIGNSDASNMMHSEENYPSNTNKDHFGCCLNGGTHSLVLDEQIGLKCMVCNFVVQEIRDIMPEFAKRQGGRGGERYYDRANFFNIDMSNIGDFTCTDFANFKPIIAPEGTVWDLIPGVINSMHPHQREGFEFIWKNISGSIYIDRAKECISSGGGSGCIISHAPGTGKTRLTIMFIQSYMQLNPDCRPLIIVPCNLLHTWEQEFKKWNVGIPFHNLSSSKYSGQESVNTAKIKGNLETVRLVKLNSWLSKKSVIGITYKLFEELAYINVNKKNKKVKDQEVAGQIRKMLLMLPGLLVLDESHIPRNQDSHILRTLLEVKTERRIMLSGTPFQNTFEELLNTLCLARPQFADQIMARDNDNYTENNRRSIKSAVKVKWASMTNTIGKIDDQKLREVKEMLKGFVHVYNGSILKEKLLGLNEYVVVLSPTNLQRNIIEIMKSRKNSFNLDHVRSIISVHPSLVVSVTLSEKEKLSIRQDELEKLRRNPNEGVKTKFVMNLVGLSRALNERVLIFAQYIDSLKIVMEHLSNHFKWTEGREILYMCGDHNEKQRQSSISLLNDPKSEAKVLLASIKACSEGINLIGASRVVLLDVNWNPSTTKQAIGRVYRFGQKKVAYVYNLIDEIWEGPKYMKQAEKVRLSALVFSCKEGGDKGESSCSVGEDKILQDMISLPSLKGIFNKILHQPNDQDLFEAFG